MRRALELGKEDIHLLEALALAAKEMEIDERRTGRIAKKDQGFLEMMEKECQSNHLLKESGKG